MEKPGKKLKKFFIITGITGMVYAGLKYLLPLVVPLLLGYTLALLLRPSARFLRVRGDEVASKVHCISCGCSKEGGVNSAALEALECHTGDIGQGGNDDGGKRRRARSMEAIWAGSGGAWISYGYDTAGRIGGEISAAGRQSARYRHCRKM